MEDVHVNCSVKLQFAERAWAATEKTWPREGFMAENKVIQRKSFLWGEECMQWQRTQTSQ